MFTAKILTAYPNMFPGSLAFSLIGNALEQCEGLITRRKIRTDRVEESIIDFVIVTYDLISDIEKIVIDEKETMF